MIVDTITHPVLSCAESIETALKDVSDVDPVFMATSDKRAALLALGVLVDQVEELRLRVLAVAEDVAEADGARDVGAWVAHRTRRDPGRCRSDLRLARALAHEREALARAVREGQVNLAQAAMINHSLDELPDDLEPHVVHAAGSRLVEGAGTFGPQQLRLLGRRVLDVVAPEVGEHHEAQALAREERVAEQKTSLTTRSYGDGTTDLRIRVADTVAQRLLTYLHAFTNPRHGESPADDTRTYPQRMGHAFSALLESIDPQRLPLHGGAATTVIVAIDFDSLRGELGTALVGDQPITATHARRLACTAGIVPAVLNGDSQVLDLGRTRRLFSPAQRTAMAVRDTTCRAEGCDIPAAWCEAHHASAPWSQGGKTDLADGLLLCSHHHRAHDPHYDTRRHTNGDVRFHRRP